MKQATFHVSVGDIPEYARLYKAVHAYLLASLLGEGKHPAYEELLEAHDAIALKLSKDDDDD